MAKKKKEEGEVKKPEEIIEPIPAPQELEKPPNVVWTDKEKEPPATVQIGLTKIDLPDAEKQKKGFHSEFAVRLVRSINGYKFHKPKGK